MDADLLDIPDSHHPGQVLGPSFPDSMGLTTLMLAFREMLVLFGEGEASLFAESEFLAFGTGLFPRQPNVAGRERVVREPGEAVLFFYRGGVRACHELPRKHAANGSGIK